MIESLREEIHRLNAVVAAQNESLRQAQDEVSRVRSHLEQDNVYLKDEIKAEQSFSGLIGESALMQRVRQSMTPSGQWLQRAEEAGFLAIQ